MKDSRSTRRSFLASAGTAAAAAIAGCSLESPVADRESDDSGEGFPEEFELPDTSTEVQVDSPWAEVYESLVDSVIGVQVDPSQPGTGGTAWVYRDNYLVTNEHITSRLEDPFVWFNDAGWREASVVGGDRYSDLGVLEVEDKPEKATPLPLVSAPPAVGTPVAAIGNPFDLNASFSTGVISGRDRTIDFPERDFSIADGVQFDAAVNPGNSGGPLVTTEGEVAGIVSAAQGDNIGFAISAALATKVVPSLIETGDFEHTYLGAYLQDVTPEIIEANDTGEYTWGVYVNQVIDNTPADGTLKGSTGTAVVRGVEVPVGGDVIVRLDDQPIQTRESLSSFLALRTDPGDSVDIQVVRDGETQTVTLTVTDRPEGGV